MRERYATDGACPVSRRTVLKSAPAAAMAALLPLDVVATPVSDSELVSAWAAYTAHRRFCDTLPVEDMTDEDFEPFNAEQERLEALIDMLPAHTSEGVAVKLRRLLIEYSGKKWIEDAMFYRLPNDALMRLESDDWRDAMLFRLIRDTERMAG